MHHKASWCEPNWCIRIQKHAPENTRCIPDSSLSLGQRGDDTSACAHTHNVKVYTVNSICMIMWMSKTQAKLQNDADDRHARHVGVYAYVGVYALRAPCHKEQYLWHLWTTPNKIQSQFFLQILSDWICLELLRCCAKQFKASFFADFEWLITCTRARNNSWSSDNFRANFPFV